MLGRDQKMLGRERLHPFYVSLGGTSFWFNGQLLGNGYDADCYTGSQVFQGSGSWGRYFFVGGPGGNAPSGNCD